MPAEIVTPTTVNLIDEACCRLHHNRARSAKKPSLRAAQHARCLQAPKWWDPMCSNLSLAESIMESQIHQGSHEDGKGYRESDQMGSNHPGRRPKGRECVSFTNLVSCAGAGLDRAGAAEAGVPGSEEVEVVALARPRRTWSMRPVGVSSLG